MVLANGACEGEAVPFKRVFRNTVASSPNRGYVWVAHKSGDRFPDGTYEGGYDTQFHAGLSVCRAKIKGGVHPGKVFGGRCNMSWGGKEVVSDEFDVLLARQDAFWHMPATEKMDLSHALVGGHEADGKPLYVCVARHVTGFAMFTNERGYHPGKYVAGKCNFGWGGKEVAAEDFYVLGLGAPLTPISGSAPGESCPSGESACACKKVRGCAKPDYCVCAGGGQYGEGEHATEHPALDAGPQDAGPQEGDAAGAVPAASASAAP